jgi:hypothetical protein
VKESKRREKAMKATDGKLQGGGTVETERLATKASTKASSLPVCAMVWCCGCGTVACASGCDCRSLLELKRESEKSESEKSESENDKGVAASGLCRTVSMKRVPTTAFTVPAYTTYRAPVSFTLVHIGRRDHSCTRYVKYQTVLYKGKQVRIIRAYHDEATADIEWDEPVSFVLTDSVAAVGGSSAVPAVQAGVGLGGHFPISCSEYEKYAGGYFKRLGELALSEAFIRNNTKPCPRCRSKIMKNGGCLHMHCQTCRYSLSLYTAGIHYSPLHYILTIHHSDTPSDGSYTTHHTLLTIHYSPYTILTIHTIYSPYNTTQIQILLDLRWRWQHLQLLPLQYRQCSDG